MRCRQLLAVLVIVMCSSACKSSNHSDSKQPDQAGAKNPSGEGTGGAAADSMSNDGSHQADPGASGSGGGNAPLDDAGKATSQRDSGPSSSDAGVDGSTSDPVDAGAADAGPGELGMGSCCSEHDTPGCSNASLQVCVCEKLTECCTEAWSTACVLIVTDKYCQPGVRDCVCGNADGQWNQPQCCNVAWSDTFCDSTAVNHCGAMPGCN
jgi:hypothetical protein